MPKAAPKSLASSDKPSKPYKGFPLFAHATGQWAKKIRGKLSYFGVWGDPQAALDKFLDHKDELLAGRKVVSKVTVRQLVNQFLTSKKARVESGELSKRTFDDYVICERILAVFGKSRPVESIGPLDFERLRTEFATTHGPVRLGKDITCVRVVFNYAYESDPVEHPVKYGGLFDKPSKAVLRRSRKPRMFTAAELRKVLGEASTQLKTMIYLGLKMERTADWHGRPASRVALCGYDEPSDRPGRFGHLELLANRVRRQGIAIDMLSDLDRAPPRRLPGITPNERQTEMPGRQVDYAINALQRSDALPP